MNDWCFGKPAQVYKTALHGTNCLYISPLRLQVAQLTAPAVTPVKCPNLTDWLTETSLLHSIGHALKLVLDGAKHSSVSKSAKDWESKRVIFTTKA